MVIEDNQFNLIIKATLNSLEKVENFSFLTSNTSKNSIEHQIRYFSFFLNSSIEKNNTKILFESLPWMYHAYYSQGYSNDYFLLLYETLKAEIQKLFPQDKIKEYEVLLDLLREKHNEIIKEAKDYQTKFQISQQEYQDLKTNFKTNILNGDSVAAKKLFESQVNNLDDLNRFYKFIIYPAMFEIGIDWENGIINHAQEHLATTVVLEVLSLLYTTIELPKITKGKIVIGAVANEFHEIGAMMLSNEFEALGWDVDYLGPNVSNEEFIIKIKEKQPFIVALSVSMPFNLKTAELLIDQIKALQIPNLKILIGGNAFTTKELCEEKCGADLYLKNIDDAIRQVEEWYK